MTADDLVSLRRDLHRKPEPAWREFYTTARIVEELESRVDLDELHVGPDAIAGDHRLAVPDDAELAAWYERAGAGTDEAILERLEGGYTGAVAVLEKGMGRPSDCASTSTASRARVRRRRPPAGRRGVPLGERRCDARLWPRRSRDDRYRRDRADRRK